MRLFVQVKNGGMPDGMAVDVEGHVCGAVNFQGKLVCYSPSGEAVATCAAPGAKMTSCSVFGGEDLSTIFITFGCLKVPRATFTRSRSKHWGSAVINTRRNRSWCWDNVDAGLLKVSL